MNLAVTVEHRFDRTPDGQVWTWSPYPYSFWRAHLEVFDSVRVVARVRKVESPSGGTQRADGDSVSFVPLPHYIGPAQFLVQAPRIRRVMCELAAKLEAVLLRAPSHVASCLHRALAAAAHPYGVEVLGDPFDVFGPGAIAHPLRIYFRSRFCRDLRRQCGSARAVSYVTREALQRRYPADPEALSVQCSDVQLPSLAFARQGERRAKRDGRFRVITVASLEQPYKGVDLLLDAVDEAARSGYDIGLTIVGDGRLRASLEARAAKLGDRVRFTGNLRADAVVSELDQADLFVLASRCEGLPKALLEAMARGLPCIGSAVGGIPELLPPDALARPGDSAALAARIREFLASGETMALMAARNLRTAREYHENSLRERRFAFYTYLRETTFAWMLEAHGKGKARAAATS